MRSKRMLVVSLLVLVLGLMSVALLAGCGSSADETTTTVAPATTTTAASTETTVGGTETTVGGEVTFDGELVIGAVTTLTGGGAMGGAEMKWAYDKAVADINAKGGVDVAGKKMKIVLKYADDKSDPVEAAAAMEKLIKVEGLKLILSTQVTPINMAAAQVAEKYQVLYQANVGWTSQWREQKFKWVPMHFFSPAEVGEVPFKMVELQPEADRPVNWGILTEDNADGQGLGAGVKAVAEKYTWMKVASYQTYTPNTKDYSSIILKFKQDKVDAIVTLISPADGITFTKQMKEQKFSPKYMMGWKGFWPTQYMQGLGADSDYVCFDAFWSEDLPNPGGKELGEAYKAEHDGLDSVSIGLFYSNVEILAMAIQNAGSTDPAKVRDAIYGATFKGTTMGDVTYGADGIAPVVPLGLQWMGGKRVVVYPDQGNKMEWFKAWDQR